jgi:hypothetical protein
VVRLLLPRLVFGQVMRGFDLRMSTNLNIDVARAKWPGDAATLPSGFQAVYQTWMTLRVQEMKSTPGAPAVVVLQHSRPNTS